MGIRVFDDLASTRDVKLERVVDVSALVRFLWAHLAIHIHDELLLTTHVQTPLINDLDPLPMLRQGNRILDDNVNLMRHTLDV
jgi:hypothetical protein